MALFEGTKEYFIETKGGQMLMADMHYHSSYELYYLDAGSRDYFVDDRFFSVTAGSFVLISPSKFHRTGGSYALRTLIGFSYDFLLKTYTSRALDNLLKCFNEVLITPPENQQKDFKRLMKLLADCKNETDFSLYLGILLKRLSLCKTTGSYDEQISSIITYINNHFAQLHNIDQIAEHFHLSKYHLCRVFKGAMGITLIDYLNQIKIKNACNFLESSSNGIMEISQLCGFNSVAYFSNVFKKITGYSPSGYRQRTH